MSAAPHLRLVEDSPPADDLALAARIMLALSIIRHRSWHATDAHNIDQVERALEGATIEQLLERH